MSPRRRSEMLEETKKKIMQAARKAFAEKGYSGASMDDLTAEVGLTRGALYHIFGDKKGLLQAIIEEIDAEMLERLKSSANNPNETAWDRFLNEGIAYIEMALEPEFQRIVLLDGPAVLGDPSKWPSQNACLMKTTVTVQEFIEQGIVKPMDAEAIARLLNGAALNAALWIAASDNPHHVLEKAVDAFKHIANGILK